MFCLVSGVPVPSQVPYYNSFLNYWPHQAFYNYHWNPYYYPQYVAPAPFKQAVPAPPTSSNPVPTLSPETLEGLVVPLNPLNDDTTENLEELFEIPDIAHIDDVDEYVDTTGTEVTEACAKPTAGGDSHGDECGCEAKPMFLGEMYCVTTSDGDGIVIMEQCVCKIKYTRIQEMNPGEDLIKDVEESDDLLKNEEAGDDFAPLAGGLYEGASIQEINHDCGPGECNLVGQMIVG